MQSVLRLGGQRWLAVLFLAIGLSTGLRLVYATPMGQVADEPSHAVRAAALLHGEIIGTRTMSGPTPDAGVHVDRGIIAASLAEYHPGAASVVSQADRARARAIQWSGQRIFDPAVNTVSYLPLLYLPGAVGIGTGGLAGMLPLQSLYLGRVFMLVAFVLLGSACLSVARVGKGVFFTLLCLPMTMSLGASLSQDGMMIACCALAGALLTMDAEKFPKARWFALAIIAVVICSKPPYGLLLFCAALPIFARGAARRLVVAGLFGLPAALWTIVMIHTSFVSPGMAPYHPGALWPGDPKILFDGPNLGAQVHVLLNKPTLIVTLPFDFINMFLSEMETSFIGDLGWLSVLLPGAQYAAWKLGIIAVLAGAVLAPATEAQRWRISDAGFVVFILIITIIAICLSIYLSWVPVGATVIDGVQGRYFLPLVPFVPLVLPRFGVLIPAYKRFERSAAMIEIISVLPAIALACYDIDALPALIQKMLG